MVTAEALTLAVPEDYDKVRNAFYAISREGVIFIRPDHQEDGVFVFKGLVVEQGAQLTHYAIINDALTNSKPGEEIFIGPGIYQENLVIAKEVTLKGSGGFRSGLIWVPSVSLVPADPSVETVSITNATVTIEEFSIGHGSYGVWIIGSSQVTLRKNRFISNDEDGIVIEDTAKVTIVDNQIFDNWNGIFVQASDAQIDIIGNRIFSNKDDGIELKGSASVTIKDNQIEGNQSCGIHIKGPSIVTQPPPDQLEQQNTMSNNQSGNICTR
jgi:parallel beta-helix repeat protein